jgi:hypothetical protein
MEAIKLNGVKQQFSVVCNPLATRLILMTLGTEPYRLSVNSCVSH